jgi:hypothetical protein
MTATAIATLVSRTSPSGIIVTTPAIVPAMASEMSVDARTCETNSAALIGRSR